jgi:hypothetical protein
MEILIVCAWCRKLRINGEWIRPIHDLTLDEPVSHGICPACKRKELEDHSDDYPKAPFHQQQR